MKSIKALLVVLTLGVMATAPVMAAAAVPNPQRPMVHINRSVSGLSRAQNLRIEAILAKGQADVAALAPDDRRVKGGEIRKAAMAEVRRQLTPGQQRQFDLIPANPVIP